MRFEKRWCPDCSFLVFDPHPCPNRVERSRAELPIAFRPLPKAPLAPLMLLPISTDSSTGPGMQIAAGACCVISSEPQIAFRPLRFHVAPELATYFDLLSLRFGMLHKFANVGAVPASCFVPPIDIDLDSLERVPFDNVKGMGTVLPGMVIALEVRNRSAAPLPFRAMFAGNAIDTTAHLG